MQKTPNQIKCITKIYTTTQIFKLSDKMACKLSKDIELCELNPTINSNPQITQYVKMIIIEPKEQHNLCSLAFLHIRKTDSQSALQSHSFHKLNTNQSITQINI